MEMALKRKERSLPALEYGVVRGEYGGRFAVATEEGVAEADAAVSCLVRPEPGDMVLLSMDDGGCAYILSILERGRKVVTTLAFESGLEVQVRNGGMSVATEEVISFAAGDFELSAQRARVNTDCLSFLGNVIESRIARIKVIAESVDSVVKRLVQRLRSSYRYVEEHDEIQSASTRMLVDGTLTMQTKNTMHTAEGHIKIDAEQIHLG
jgi:hypothetical protein